MTEHEIIDIEPIEVSSSQIPEATYEIPLEYARADTHGSSGKAPNFAQTSQKQTRGYTVVLETNNTSEKKPSRIVGLIQIVLGALCVMIGIPLLILPGPGLLAIGLGLALVARGLRNLFWTRPINRTRFNGNSA